MRFDLTYAAFRAIDRASHEQLPLSVSTEISAAKLLIALFKEEDCRAALWLCEAGLSLIKFRDEFDLDILEKNATYQPTNHWSDDNSGYNSDNNSISGDNSDSNSSDTNNFARLYSPISAPSFQSGSYGIPAEAYSAVTSVQHDSVKAVAASNNPNSATNIAVPTDPDGGGNSASQYSSKKRDPKQDADELTLSENNPPVQSSKRYYSLFNVNSDAFAADARVNPIPIQSNKRNHWFYVDDQPVNITQLSAELEVAIETIGQQRKILGGRGRKIPITDGGVRTIETSDNKSLSSQPIATEHLLLAVSMDSSDVGNWLSDHGLDSTTLRERIASLNNYNSDSQDQFNHQFASSDENSVEEKILETSNFDLENLSELDKSSKLSEQNKSYDSSELGESGDYRQLSYKIYRLLDAAANRASEAVRAIEDYARFIIDNQSLTRKLKDFRHNLQMILSPIDFSKRLAARETESDIGREIEAENEYRRDSIKSVIDANFSRLQESLRSIEEFSKINHVEISRRVEGLRYQSYVLHKEFSSGSRLKFRFGLTDNSLSRMRLVELISGAKLYVLVDCMEDEFVFRERVRGMIEGGGDVIQIRDKSASDQTILGRFSILHDLVDNNENRVILIVNDRPDLAKLSGADGVHVGQDDLSVKMARQILGDEYLVGVSTHNMDQVRRAVVDGADYIGVGPIFESSTKSFENFAGIEFLNEFIESTENIPAFAIGGINENNIEKVVETGFSRVAVSKSIQSADDTKQSAEKLKSFLVNV
ncbi:MAG: thiamine phosphate synthase [Planctomycetaceae bacterium]|jgi:thiamine-phosphate pyrophosphorylase|nr:thiamine phosphate synthase [Planctomycetaceae bacterium]